MRHGSAAEEEEPIQGDVFQADNPRAYDGDDEDDDNGDDGRPYIDDNDDREGDRRQRRPQPSVRMRVQQRVRLYPGDRTSGRWRSTIYSRYCGERDVERRGLDQRKKDSGGSGGDRDIDDKDGDWDRDRDEDLDCDAEDIDDIHNDNDRPFASYDNNDDGDGYDDADDVDGGRCQQTVSLPPLDSQLWV